MAVAKRNVKTQDVLELMDSGGDAAGYRCTFKIALRRRSHITSVRRVSSR